MGSAEICGNCRFWDQIEGDEKRAIGECRRHPPVIVGPMVDSQIAHDFTLFPETEAWRWCGEYQMVKPGRYFGV